MLFNVLTVFASLVVAVIILEVGLRVWLKNDHSVPNDRDIFFRKNWDEKYGTLNSLGFRDDEVTRPKQTNTFRIIVLGDSLTFGQGIKNLDDIWTEILENRLNQLSNRDSYEVVNLAKQGYNVRQYLETLINTGLTLEPDLVMIGFFINDIEADKKMRPESFRILPEKMHWALSRLSFAYWYTNYALSSIKSGDKWLNYKLSYTDPSSYHWKQYVDHWKQLLLICEKNSLKVVVIILPNNIKFNDEHPFIAVYENVSILSKN